MLDTAAERLAAAEASGRQAWRTLLQLDMRSAKEFDEVVQDELNAFSFPGGQVPGATEAVDDFAAAVDNLAMFEGRLELRLRAGHPAVAALASAREKLSSAATTMAFAGDGSIGSEGDDLSDCLSRFYPGLTDKEAFLAGARRFVAVTPPFVGRGSSM